MIRVDSRTPDQLRPVGIERGWSAQAEGSALINFGNTKVLATASFTCATSSTTLAREALRRCLTPPSMLGCSGTPAPRHRATRRHASPMMCFSLPPCRPRLPHAALSQS